MRHRRANDDPYALQGHYREENRARRQARYQTPLGSGRMLHGRTYLGPTNDYLIGTGPDGGMGLYYLFNGAMKSAIDHALAFKAVDDAQQSTLNYQGDLITYALGELTAQAGHIITLQGKVAAAEGTIASQGARIASLESELAGINGQLASIGDQLGGVSGGIAGLVDAVEAHENSITVLRMRVTALENAGGGGNPTDPGA